MSEKFITLLIPTSLIPDQKDCQLLKDMTKTRLVVVIDTSESIAFGVNPDTDPSKAEFVFTVQVNSIASLLTGIVTGDVVACKIPPADGDADPQSYGSPAPAPQTNGTADAGPPQYSLEIGGNKPPPPGPRLNEDAAFKLAIAIGSDSTLVQIASAASLSVTPKPPSGPV